MIDRCAWLIFCEPGVSHSHLISRNLASIKSSRAGISQQSRDSAPRQTSLPQRRKVGAMAGEDPFKGYTLTPDHQFQRKACCPFYWIIWSHAAKLGDNNFSRIN
jgi:hypothetical protein